MQIQQHQEIPQELLCPICMGIFNPPVSIECGHTFCRKCLLNSVGQRNLCPICRKNIASLPQRPNQDETLLKIIDSFNNYNQCDSQKMNNNGDKTMQTSTNFLLLDIRSSQLLLPYTKIVGTFQLQSQTLINKLNRFVVRQQRPFNKFGIVSKMVSLNRISHNIYQCTIQGKSFCHIQNDTVQKGQDLNQEYFYRCCSAKVIYEQQKNLIDQQDFVKFSELLANINDKKLLETAYKIIDYQAFSNINDQLAIFYSISRLIAVNKQKKYEIVTSFNEQQRKKWLKQYIQAINFDVSKNASKFIDVERPNPALKNLAIFILVAVIFYFFMSFDTNNNQSI